MQEPPPSGVRIVSLCRTERKHLLKLHPGDYLDLPLQEFDKAETQQILEAKFPSAILTEIDIDEFHRLSGGNPRVQANALDQAESLEKAVEYLGPYRTSVDEQIAFHLQSVINNIKKKHPDINVDLLCSGLAILPPFIPVIVLAEIANVDSSMIKSFAVDMGRPLWLLEESLQFRDEPTETWFKNNYEATQEQLNNFIRSIKPLTSQYAYASESLPALLLKAGQYDELIDLALSENFLPVDSPIDQRTVKLSRLQFALKAALKKQDLFSVAKLALRAGEETAGSQRQLSLFKKNIDLLPLFEPIQKVQEIAFQRQLSGAWDGSEHAYSASLLSHINEFHGEAQSYLRNARNWLNIYFNERSKRSKNDRGFKEKLHDDEIVELAITHMNIRGDDALIDFFSRWSPKELGYRVGRPIIKRLADHSKFEAIENLDLAP